MANTARTRRLERNLRETERLDEEHRTTGHEDFNPDCSECRVEAMYR